MKSLIICMKDYFFSVELECKIIITDVLKILGLCILPQINNLCLGFGDHKNSTNSCYLPLPLYKGSLSLTFIFLLIWRLVSNVTVTIDWSLPLNLLFEPSFIACEYGLNQWYLFFLNVQGDEHNWQKHKSGRCQIVWWFQWSSHRSFKVTVLSLEKLFIVYSTFLPKVFIWVKSYWSHITGMWCPPNPIWRGLIMLVKFKVKVIVISVYLVKRTNAVKEHQLLANWNVWFWRN